MIPPRLMTRFPIAFMGKKGDGGLRATGTEGLSRSWPETRNPPVLSSAHAGRLGGVVTQIPTQPNMTCQFIFESYSRGCPNLVGVPERTPISFQWSDSTTETSHYSRRTDWVRTAQSAPNLAFAPVARKARILQCQLVLAIDQPSQPQEGHAPAMNTQTTRITVDQR